MKEGQEMPVFSTAYGRYDEILWDMKRRQEEKERRKWRNRFGRVLGSVMLFICAVLMFAFGVGALVSLFTMQWGLFFVFAFLYVVLSGITGAS